MINHQISSTIPSFSFYEKYDGKYTADDDDDDCLSKDIKNLIIACVLFKTPLLTLKK